MLSRRSFLHSSLLVVGGTLTGMVAAPKPYDSIITVKGSIPAKGMGLSLIHEHILVDFIGAADYDPKRWERSAVIKKVLPYLQEVRAAGCKTLVDCTPNYLGRDVRLL